MKIDQQAGQIVVELSGIGKRLNFVEYVFGSRLGRQGPGLGKEVAQAIFAKKSSLLVPSVQDAVGEEQESILPGKTGGLAGHGDVVHQTERRGP